MELAPLELVYGLGCRIVTVHRHSTTLHEKYLLAPISCMPDSILSSEFDIF